MRLKDYAHQQGISYKIAWRWWKAGKLPGHQMNTGPILLESEPSPVVEGSSQGVAVYAQGSSAENTGNRDSQAERLVAYCTARGSQVARVVKELSSGINAARPKLLALLEDHGLGLIVVEHKERIT